MKTISGIWARRRLTTRLIVASGMAVVIALGVATGLSIRLASLTADRALESRLQENIAFLSEAMAVSLQSPHALRVEEVLGEYLLLPGVKTAGFHGETEARLMQSSVIVIQTAPDWFVRLCGLTDRQEARPVQINGQKRGVVSMTMSPTLVLNQQWAFLSQQVLILLAGATIVFIGTWLALRANLKPFAALVHGSRAFGRGDFTQRIPLVGSGEFQTTIKAFNTMANDLEHQIDALKDSKSFYATLIEHAPVGVAKTDRQGNPLFINDALRRLSGIDTKIDKENWTPLFHPDDRDRVTEIWQRMLHQGIGGHFPTRYLRPDGSTTWVQIQVLPIFDEMEKVDEFLFVATDITAEREQRDKAERSAKLYATLSRVNSIIIHAQNEEEMYRDVSDAVIDSGGFDAAAITLVDWAKRKARLFSCAGVGEWRTATVTNASELDIDDFDARTLSGLGLLSGVTETANDYQNDQRISTRMRELAKAQHAAAASVVPFRRGGETVAVFMVMSSEVGFFTEDIIALLEEIGRDVSFALDNFVQTEQKRLAELAVMRSEQHLNVTLHSIGDAVLVTDAAGMVTMMNPVAEMLTGWTEADARGKPATEVFHIINQETRQVVDNPISHVLREGVIVGLANHTVLIAKDGSERPIADSGAPIRYDNANAINGVILVFRDQSDEYRMLKALRDSEALYSSLAENVPIGVYVVDMKGDIRYLNKHFSQMFGLNAGGSSITRIGMIVHPDDHERLTCDWIEACKRKELTDLGVYRCFHADHSLVWIHGLLAPIFDADGQQTLFVGVMENITAEREQHLSIERLSRFNATLSQINAAIVHSRTTQDLYERICRVATERGGFSGAAVYEVGTEGKKAHRVLLHGLYDKADGQRLGEIDLDIKKSWTIIGEAIRSGRVIVSPDMRTDERLSSYWHDVAKDFGLSAACAIPLSRFGQTIGVFALNVNGDDFQDEEILVLIEEIGRDVSYAIENIAREEMRKLAEVELARNEQRLRLGLSITNTGMFEANLLTGKIYFDSVAAHLLCLATTAIEIKIADYFLQGCDTSEREFGNSIIKRLVDGEIRSYDEEKTVTLSGGRVRWLRHQAAVTDEHDGQGKPFRLLGVISDISESRAMEERSRMAATVFDNSGEAIMITGIDMKVIMVNQAFTRNTGYSTEEIIGADSGLLRSDQHDDNFYQNAREAMERDTAWQGEIWRRRKNGVVYPALINSSVVRDKNGAITHFVTQETDISTKKAFEERISHLAYRDPLTDLPNRTLLRDRVDQGIAIAQREKTQIALLFLDLDHFKNINDSLGHAVGDRLLKETAQRLSHSIRAMDTVGRLGGDEFLIMLPDANADAAAHVAQKLLKDCARPFVLESHSLAVTPSIGIAMYPKDGTSFDELLKTADTAMYRSKSEGRNAYRFYTPEMNQAVFKRMVMESNLRRAVEQHEFVLHYQPKFELQGQKLIGVEALIRWYQPEMGLISPGQFVSIAEDSGLIEPIGKWVLEHACQQNKQWRDMGLPAISVAVNFSVRQFAARNIVELVTETLRVTGLSGDGLEMEITESLLAKDMDYTLDVFHSLKTLGIRISVDDFGTGYSSLSYLKRFPIDRLKIDQSFVRDLVSDADRAIANTIVTLGHSLGMQVIAEGVETAQQMDILRDMGCDEVQGYYFGRPVTADEMTSLLQKLATESSRGA